MFTHLSQTFVLFLILLHLLYPLYSPSFSNSSSQKHWRNNITTSHPPTVALIFHLLMILQEMLNHFGRLLFHPLVHSLLSVHFYRKCVSSSLSLLFIHGSSSFFIPALYKMFSLFFFNLTSSSQLLSQCLINCHYLLLICSDLVVLFLQAILHYIKLFPQSQLTLSRYNQQS